MSFVKTKYSIEYRFNGKAREGIQALDDIHNRASYELFADVLLVRSSIFCLFGLKFSNPVVYCDRAHPNPPRGMTGPGRFNDQRACNCCVLLVFQPQN